MLGATLFVKFVGSHFPVEGYRGVNRPRVKGFERKEQGNQKLLPNSELI